MRRSWSLVALAFVAGSASSASAQVHRDGAADVPAAAAVGGPGVLGSESPELRALRLSELEVFAHVEPLVDLGDVATAFGLPPDAVTTEAPPAGTPLPRDTSPRDLSWLSGLALPDIPVRWDDRVVRYLEFFRDDPRGRSIIRSWMQRTERYGPMIRRTLREEGLPEDILYLAMIESGFDPRARSEVGAVGLWQFMSRTGEEYGLEQTHWVDERMDPVESTRAGAHYLLALYRRLGTWELAFAAYNMGYGGLLRAMRKYGTNDYWLLARTEAAIPFETSLYVAKIMACAIAGRNGARFGLAELTREGTSTFDEVEVPGGTQFALIARAAETTADELRRLNPMYRRDRVTPSATTVRVRVPANAAERFRHRWPTVRPGRAAHVPYVVRFGEDLAAVAHRFRTNERTLRDVNQLEDHTRVSAGFDLMVPATPARDERPSEPPVVPIPRARFDLVGTTRVFYRVVRGDRLDEIARFFRVSTEHVREWNAIDPRAQLQDGIYLQLFVPRELDLSRAVVLTESEVRPLVVGSEEFFQHHLEQEGRVRIRHRVASGDTLSSIAQRYGLSIASMSRINLIPRDTVLALGQELVVYTLPERLSPEQRAELGITLRPRGGAAGAAGSPASASPETAEAEGAAPTAPDATAEPATAEPATEPTTESPTSAPTATDADGDVLDDEADDDEARRLERAADDRGPSEGQPVEGAARAQATDATP